MDTNAKPAGAWKPAAVAVVIGIAMVWLAGGPLEADLGDTGLLTPAAGPRPEFPRRFAWTPVPGADLYEISVVTEPAGELVFRQTGSTAVLDLDFDPGAGPPAGDYAWEVRAFRGNEELGAAVGRFRVVGTP